MECENILIDTSILIDHHRKQKRDKRYSIDFLSNKLCDYFNYRTSVFGGINSINREFVENY